MTKFTKVISTVEENAGSSQASVARSQDVANSEVMFFDGRSNILTNDGFEWLIKGRKSGSKVMQLYQCKSKSCEASKKAKKVIWW